MEDTESYLERKHQELLLISGCLGHPAPARPENIEEVIEKKFRLAAELKSEHALDAWQSTQTRWNTASLRSGPFAFNYRYQRADLIVSGPLPYRDLDSIREAEPCSVSYTCSGMAAVSAVLFAFADRQKGALLHLPGCYKETLELAESFVPELYCLSLRAAHRDRAPPQRQSMLWLDWPIKIGSISSDVRRAAQAADVIVFDTTCFSAASGCIRRFLEWARCAGTPVVLVRSHTKLDTLGIEYGRLGSIVFVAFRDTPALKRRRLLALAEKTEDAVRLLGNRALPAQFCPFFGSTAYWTLSARRSAALLRNGRFFARRLLGEFGSTAVRAYPHGMFAALVPPHLVEQDEAAAEAERLSASLARRSLPVRHAGSFGFDFVAVEGFFDTEIDRHVIRVAVADLPTYISKQVAEQVVAWWTDRWRAKAA